MTHTAAMLDNHPGTIHLDKALLARAIDQALICSQTCTACGDACLSEDAVANLTACIRLNLDCAAVCATTVEVLSRHTGYDADVTRAQLQACIASCRACGDMCEHHARMYQHCRICADACRACEVACRELLASIG